MKIIHFSDTHLGYSTYRKTDPSSGLNQREADVYSVFKEIVDCILKTKPDLVIHAGDLFDSVRPPNRAIIEAFVQLSKLSSAHIPTVIVAGNHETPRQKITGSVFKLLEYFPNIYPVYEGEYRTIEIPDAKIHAIPHSYTAEDLQNNFKNLKVDKNFKYNILVTHAAVRGVEGFGGAEFKEQPIPISALSPEFDYIALGHYHRYMKIKDNAYYSGSPERFSFNEAKDKKGFLDIELGQLRVKHVQTSARQMIDLSPMECSKLDASKIMKEIENILSGDVEDKIVRISLQDVPLHVYTALDFQRIDELKSKTLECDIQFIKKREAIDTVGGTIGGISDEFRGFVGRQRMEKRQRVKLERLGLEYLRKAIEITEAEE